MTRLWQYLTALAALLIAALAALAAEPTWQCFVEGTLYSGTNAVGYFCHDCIDKKAAQDLLAKYTNNITGIGKGYTLSAQLHTCGHDFPGYKSCTDERLCGKDPIVTTATGFTNKAAVVALVVTAKDKKTLRDHTPTFRIPVTDLTASSIITKIVTEEFPGKTVTTNVTAISAEVTK